MRGLIIFSNLNKGQNQQVYAVSRKFLISSILVGMTLLVYAQVSNFQFINFDDGLYVVNNPNVQAPISLKSIFGAFTSFQAANWHPLTWLSHLLDFQLYGLNAGGHHLTSLFIHLANTILLFLVFEKITGGIWQSALVAALFAIHPLHVESVAQIAERKDVLSAFIWLLTLRAYLYYVKYSGIYRYLLVLLFFALGLMAKPMLVTLPFVLLLLDYWPLVRFQGWGILKGGGLAIRDLIGSDNKNVKPAFIIFEKIPFFLLSAASSVITLYAQQSAGAMNQILPITTRVSNTLVSYMAYLGKLIWPKNLSFFYVYSTNLPFWQIIGSGLLLVLIFLWVLRKWKRYPYLAVGWLWYIGTLVPVIGLIQVGTQSMADRYTYLPLVGIFIIIAWGIPDLFAQWSYRKIFLKLTASILLPVLMIFSWLQVGYWQNSLSLFEHALKVENNNFKAHDLLGVILTEQGKFDKALFHFQEAKRIRPNHGPVYNNLGVALEKNGRMGEAIVQYSEALRVQPGLPEAHYNLGMIMIRQGDLQKAGYHFQAALQGNKNYAEAYNGLGVVSQHRGLIAEAINQYSEALRLMPFYALAHYNLGTALLRAGKIDGAIEHFEEALKIEPNYYKALNNLGWAQAQKGRTQEAIISFRKALIINPQLIEAQESLRNLLQKEGK